MQKRLILQCFISIQYFAKILPNVQGLRNSWFFASPHPKVAMVIIRAQSSVILKKGRVAAFKWLFNVLNNNIRFYVFDILTQDLLKEIDSV